MSLEVIISIAVALTLLGVIGVKWIIARIFHFKMDESAILQALQQSTESSLSLEQLEQATMLSAQRISQVCQQSTRLQLSEQGVQCLGR